MALVDDVGIEPRSWRGRGPAVRSMVWSGRVRRREWFEQWRASGEFLYVIRFRLIKDSARWNAASNTICCGQETSVLHDQA